MGRGDHFGTILGPFIYLLIIIDIFICIFVYTYWYIYLYIHNYWYICLIFLSIYICWFIYLYILYCHYLMLNSLSPCVQDRAQLTITYRPFVPPEPHCASSTYFMHLRDPSSCAGEFRRCSCAIANIVRNIGNSQPRPQPPTQRHSLVRVGVCVHQTKPNIYLHFNFYMYYI